MKMRWTTTLFRAKSIWRNFIVFTFDFSKTSGGGVGFGSEKHLHWAKCRGPRQTPHKLGLWEKVYISYMCDLRGVGLPFVSFFENWKPAKLTGSNHPRKRSAGPKLHRAKICSRNTHFHRRDINPAVRQRKRRRDRERERRLEQSNPLKSGEIFCNWNARATLESRRKSRRWWPLPWAAFQSTLGFRTCNFSRTDDGSHGPRKRARN